MDFPLDAWRWNEYWVPLELVIEFKRDVYQMALTELARFLPRGTHQNRYLRASMRPYRGDDEQQHQDDADAQQPSVIRTDNPPPENLSD